MKQLLIGLDLSFSCSGISITNMLDFEAQHIQFHRVIFDDQSTKKEFNPSKIQNVNDSIYRMPTNAPLHNIVYDSSDNSCMDQVEFTLKSMVASKRISHILNEAVNYYKPDIIYVGIENYVAPTFGGKFNFKSVGGLITLQAMVRESLIRLSIAKNIELKLFTPSVSSIKLYFSGSGRAEKIDMLKSFIETFDGNKLLPTIKITDVGRINDVIDAFAISVYIFSLLMNK